MLFCWAATFFGLRNILGIESLKPMAVMMASTNIHWFRWFSVSKQQWNVGVGNQKKHGQLLVIDGVRKSPRSRSLGRNLVRNVRTILSISSCGSKTCTEKWPETIASMPLPSSRPEPRFHLVWWILQSTQSVGHLHTPSHRGKLDVFGIHQHGHQSSTELPQCESFYFSTMLVNPVFQSSFSTGLKLNLGWETENYLKPTRCLPIAKLTYKLSSLDSSVDLQPGWFFIGNIRYLTLLKYRNHGWLVVKQTLWKI